MSDSNEIQQKKMSDFPVFFSAQKFYAFDDDKNTQRWCGGYGDLKNVIKCDVLNTQASAGALPDIFNAEILHIFRLQIKIDEAKRASQCRKGFFMSCNKIPLLWHHHIYYFAMWKMITAQQRQK